MPAPFRTLLLAAALLVPGIAAAQEAPADTGQIVVTGVRPSESEIETFVEALTPGAPGSQLSRFHWAVCPSTVGVAPGQANAVSDRIRTVARAAGIAVAQAPCTPNLLVIVTPDKAAFLAALRTRRPEYFDGLNAAERRAINDPSSPVAAWHVDGPPLTAEGHELAPIGGSAALRGGVLPQGVYTNGTTRQASRMGFATRPQFAAAILVVEERALAGLTTIQLADYAAMRTLLESDPDRLGNSRAPTILRIIDAPMGSEVPLTLTRWDFGILKAFYASPPATTAAVQRTETRRGLTEALEGERN